MAFGNESSAAKSARVKLQLRDKKGRWIEMGGGVKWYSSNLGKYMFGKVTDVAGPGLAKVEVDTGNPAKPLTVNIPSSQLEKVKAKASLAPATNEKIDPEISVDSKSEVTPPKEKSNTLFEELHKNSADSKNPFGPGYEKVPFDPKGTDTLEKNDLVTFMESGVLKKGHVIGFQDDKPIIQSEVSPQWGFGGKGTIQPLVNIYDLYKPIGSNPSDAGSPDTEAKSSLVPSPDGETPALVIPKQAEEPEEANEKDSKESEKSDKTEEKPAEGVSKDAFGKDMAISGNIKATSNEQNSPGSFYVESADGTPLVTSVADLKPGDKVYPVGTVQKPYGTHGNYNPKGTHVSLGNAAGIGTVLKKGPNYASVEGEDGKTYYPTNKFVALKVTPDTEKALEQISTKAKNTISQDEADAIQSNKDNITQKANDLLENGIPATQKPAISVESLVDAEEGSAVLDGADLTDPSSTIVYKKKADGTWISLGGSTKTSAELSKQVFSDAKLVTPAGYVKYQVGNFMDKQPSGAGVSDNHDMYVKNVNGTWSNIKDENTELSTDQVTTKLNTLEALKIHSAEEVEESKKALTTQEETIPVDLPASDAESVIEQFGKVYSDDQGEYMVGKNGAKFRKGEKVLTSGGKGEESTILALYEGVESARVLLPNGKKSIKKINTLVHSNKSSEDDTAAPEADIAPKTQGKPSAMKQPAAEAEIPIENPDESAYDDSMPTNPALVDEEPVDSSEEEPTVAPEDMPELEQAAGPIDVSSWKKIKSSSGSNPGGEYEAPDGTHYFVKQSMSDRHAKNEVLASDIYLAAGVHSLELGYSNVDGKGKLGTIAPMLDGAKENFQSKLSDPEYKKAFQEGWAVDAWLGNWDVAGLVFDNVMTDKDGKAIRIDPGGALLFRAMGSPKPDSMFTDEVIEWDSMRTNPDNEQSYAVFNDMTDQQIVDSVNKVSKFTDEAIDALVDKNNFDEADATKLKQKLKARRDDLVDKALGLNLMPSFTPTESGTVDEEKNKFYGGAVKATPNNESTSVPKEVSTFVQADIDTLSNEIQTDIDSFGSWNSVVDNINGWAVGDNGLELRGQYNDPGVVSLYDADNTFIDSFKFPFSNVEAKVLMQHANGELDHNSQPIMKPKSTPQEDFDNGLAQWEKDLLDSAIAEANEPSVSELEPPIAEDYSKPGTTYVSPYNGEDTVTGKNSKPVYKGVDVSYTKKGETKEGKVVNILVNQQSASVKWPDGTTSIIKGSQLHSKEEAKSAPVSQSSFTEPVPEPAIIPNTEDLNGWNDDAPLAADLPIGSFIAVPFAANKYTKTGTDEWTSAIGGGIFPNATIDSTKGLKNTAGQSAYKLTVADIIVPESTSTKMPWNNQAPTAEELPIGSKLTTDKTGVVVTYEKTGANAWDNKTAGSTGYSNTVINSVKNDTGYEVEIPNTVYDTAPTSNEPVEMAWNTSHDLTAADLPIGTTMGDSPTSGYKKTADNEWTSNNGKGTFKYPDENMDSSKGKDTEGGYYKMYLPAGSNMPKHVVPEEPVVPENIWDKNEKSAVSLPLGSKLKFGATVITKVEANKWTSNTTSIEYYNSDINSLPVNIWTYEIPEDAVEIDPSSKTVSFDNSIPNEDQLPIGAVIKSPTGIISYQKDSDGIWKDNYGDKIVGPSSKLNTLKDIGWSVTYNPEKALQTLLETDTATDKDIDAYIGDVTSAMSTAINDFSSTYEESATWDLFVTLFDEGEIDIENIIFVQGKKYYVAPAADAGLDSAFMLLDDSLVTVDAFNANLPYGNFDSAIFKKNLEKAINNLPTVTDSVIPPTPVSVDSIPDEFSIATVNLTLNEYVEQISSMAWTQIKTIAEPALFKSVDGKKWFMLQAHPMSTPYFQKFQIIDEEGKDIPTENDLMWDGNYGETKFTGQDILEAIEKEIGATNFVAGQNFNIEEGTKLSEVDYKDFAALPAGTKINYLVNNKVYGTYLKNSNNSWRFQQANKEKPSHKSDSNADFKFIMDNNPEMASNYQILAPDAPEPEVTEVPVITEAKKYEFAGVKVSEDSLEEYPTGTVVKVEASSYYNNNNTYMYKKVSGGKWEQWKKTANTLSKTNTIEAAALSNSLNWTGKTASVSVPKSDNHVMLGNGQIAYTGDEVFSFDSNTFYSIEKINKSYINLLDMNGNKVKLPSKKLYINSNYGVKAQTDYTGIATSKYDLTTSNPLETYLESAKAAKAAESALSNFAGASGFDYDVQGLGLKYSKNALENKKSGLSVVEVKPADTTHELYGKPQPMAPVAVEEYPSFEESVLNNLPKWDSAEWLKGVEERYAANPNKKFDSVQKSTQWSKVQAVLDGNPGWVNYLDQLQNSKYVDDALYSMAKEGIKKQEEINKPLQKAHNENIAKEKAEYAANKAVYLAEYSQKMEEYTKQLSEWSTVNTNIGDIKKLPTLPTPSSTPFTGGPADWSKAHPGTHSVQSIMDAMREDNVLGRFGLSAAVGADKIEDNIVSFQKVLDASGQEKFEIHFKVTHAFGNLLDSQLKGNPDAKRTNGIYYNRKTNMFGKPDDALAKLAGKPTDSKFVNDGNRYEFTDGVTNYPVVFQHSTQQGQNVSVNNNSVQILMDINATPADLQVILENMGLDAKPSTAGSLRVTAENKLITLFSGKSNLGDENFSGDKRTKALKDIKETYDISVDDVVVETDPNGHMTFFLSDAKAEKLASEFEVNYFQHSIYAGEDPDVWESILTGANPGLLSNYHRGNYGIGELKSSTGMSPDKDMAVGSGDHLFVSPISKPTQAPYSSYIGIKTKSILRRLDIWANMGDDYGKKNKNNQAPFPLMKNHNYFNEAIVRDSIPLADFQWVNIGSAAGKKELIKRLNAKGIFMINGLPLEKFILSVGEPTPDVPDVNTPGLELVDIEVPNAVAEAPAAPAAGPAV